MELIFLLFAFLLFCFMLLKIANKTSRLKLPPGPRQLPIIGNLHQISCGLLHHVLRDLAKKYGPLMHLKLGEVSSIIITSPEVAKEVFKTHDILFSQRPTNHLAFQIISYNFTDIIFSPYGNYWRNLRKICIMELLSSKRVQTFQSTRDEEVLNLIRSIFSHEGKSVNLSQNIFSLTYGITSRAAFGKRNKYQVKFEELVAESNKLLSGFSISDLYPSLKLPEMISGMRRKMETTHSQVDEILENILYEHKEQMGKSKLGSEDAKEDLVDVLLNIQKRGDFEEPLTDTNIKAVLFDIFSAGSETSSTSLEWAISETLKNPRILKRAQDEVRNMFDDRGNVDESSLDGLKYLQAIVKETFRFHPSAPLLVPRECSEQCTINGYDIPAKARVIVNAWAIGRDPKFWTEAEVFKPERFLDSEVDYKGNYFEYIPFGAGRRMCPGISFALPNIMLPLAQLLFHFDWKLSGELKLEDLDMAETMGVTVRRKNELSLIPVVHCRSCLKIAAQITKHQTSK